MDELLAMGFPESDVRVAWSRSGNSLEAALEYLLSGPAENVPSSDGTEKVLVLPISQYSFAESGSSACTVIAASMLDFLLKALREGLDPHALTMEQLVQVVQEGVERFSRLPRTAVQHLAADELDRDFFANIRPVEGAMIQGLLTDASSFNDAIETARRAGRSDMHTGVVLTKPPETVCLVVPPATAATAQRTLLLFDSHSRPQEGIEGAYLVIASDQRAIVERLKRIFPAFPCGDLDDGGYMSMMYNMFEGTLFQCAS